MAPNFMKRIMARLSTGHLNITGSAVNGPKDSTKVNPVTSLATKAWVGKTVNILGQDGFIRCAANGEVTTSWLESGMMDNLKNGMTDKILIEHVDGDWVAFRVVGTNLYLTQHLYGDEARAELAKTLLENAPQILPELLPQIIEYLVGEPSTKDNFEGAGFNYHAMTAQPGPPNALQQFTLVPDGYLGKLGVKSRFGKFWRSEHWNHVVSQSPHLLGDEMWYFSDA